MASLDFVLNKKVFLKKVAIVAVAVIIFVSSGYGIGLNSAKTEINGEKLKYEEVVKEIEDAKKDIDTYEAKVKEIQSKIKSVNNEYAQRKTEFDEALKIFEQKDTIAAEVTKLSGEVESKKGEIATLDTSIQSKKNEIASLDQVIKEKKEAPIQLPAGQFVVGKDIPAGRYKVLPVGRGANFFVYDSNGNNVVNTIIYSNSDFGVSEYITLLSDGYIIDAHSSFKYVPVE
nr:hypothetical protein [Neobacillus sp. Marseille-Q6967]